MDTIVTVVAWKYSQWVNGVQSVIIIGKYLKPLWLVNKLVFHMGQPKQLVDQDLVGVRDRFGLMIFTVKEMKQVCLTVIRTIPMESITVDTIMMLVQSVYQSVSYEHYGIRSYQVTTNIH